MIRAHYEKKKKNLGDIDIGYPIVLKNLGTAVANFLQMQKNTQYYIYIYLL